MNIKRWKERSYDGDHGENSLEGSNVNNKPAKKSVARTLWLTRGRKVSSIVGISLGGKYTLTCSARYNRIFTEFLLQNHQKTQTSAGVD